MHLIACRSRCCSSSWPKNAAAVDRHGGGWAVQVLRFHIAICICLSNTVSSHVSGQRGHGGQVRSSGNSCHTHTVHSCIIRAIYVFF